MAKFPDLRAYFYHDELIGLKECYQTAEAAMESRRTSARKDIEDYQQQLANGAEWEGERDDDGSILWSRNDALDIAEFNAYLAINTLRESFVVTLFHFWEKSAREWTGSDERDYRKIKRLVRKLGYHVHPELNVLNKLTNYLKHSNPKLLDELHPLAKYLFRSEGIPKGKRGPLQITSTHLNRFFDIVTLSGPPKFVGRLADYDHSSAVDQNGVDIMSYFTR